MRMKIALFIALGAVLTVASGVASFSYMRALEGQLAEARASIRGFSETTSVPVLSRDAARGASLTVADFSRLVLPTQSLPENLIVDLPHATGEEGFIALGDLKAGQVLFDADIAKTGAAPSFDFILSQNARAIAVSARNIADFKAFLKPGVTVDLFWTQNIGGGTTETRLLGSALRVLALPAQDAAAATKTGTGPDVQNQLILEGLAIDAARVIQAGSKGFFDILPAENRLSGAAGEISIGLEQLATLPLVVRSGSGQEQDRSGALGMVERIAGPVKKTCSTVVVRAASRSVVEVPC